MPKKNSRDHMFTEGRASLNQSVMLIEHIFTFSLHDQDAKTVIEFYQSASAMCVLKMQSYVNSSTNPSTNDTNWHFMTLVYDGTLTGNTNRLRIDGAIHAEELFY